MGTSYSSLKEKTAIYSSILLKYCTYSTTAPHTITLHILVDFVHLCLVLTFSFHGSFNIDVSAPLVLTCGHLANNYNAPVLSGLMLAIRHIAIGQGSLDMVKKMTNLIAKLGIDLLQLKTCLKFDIIYQKRTHSTGCMGSAIIV